MNATVVAKVTGTPDSKAWTQIYEFSDELGQKGKFIVLVSLKFQSEISEIERLRNARAIAANIQTIFFQDKSELLLDSLKNALSSVESEIPPDINYEIAALSIVEKIFYAAAVGGSAVYLIRGGVVAPLIKSSDGLLAGSGYYSQQDKLLLTTKDLNKNIPDGVLKGLLETGESTNFGEQIARLIHKDANTSSCGVLLVELGEEKKVPIEEIIPTPDIKLPKVKTKVVSVLDNIIAKIPDKKIRIERETFLADTNSRKKLAPLLGIILLVVLVISIAFGVRRERVQSAKSNLNRELDQITHDFDEAKNLTSLNPDRARELAVSARNRAKELKASGIEDKGLEELFEKIDSEIGSITGIYEGGSSLYLDLALLSSGFKGGDLASSGTRMVVLDKESKKAVEIDIPTKRTKVIAGPDYFRDALSISAYSDRSFILSSDGIREVGDEVELLIKPDGWSSNEVLMNSFAGNIYLVDKQNNNIYRFAGAGSGFSSKSDWLAPGINRDVTKAISLEIDGSLWVLTSEGKILRFLQGLPQTFSPTDTFSLFGTVDLFTDEEAQYLYILDPKNSRILVMDKEGNYKAEYVSDDLKEATKIIVSESEKKIIFLAQDKLWLIEIKH